MRIHILTVNAESLCVWCAASYKACVHTIFFPSQFNTEDATLVLRPPGNQRCPDVLMTR